MIWDVIIIGGGVAGLAAASEANGLKTLVIEKTSHCGNKLLLSGAGQCNVTHSGNIKDFENNYSDKWKFIRNVMNEFDNENLIEKFKKYKIDMVVLENKKVFPKSLKALDILNSLLLMANDNDVKINRGETVVKIEYKEKLVHVKTDKSMYETKKIIIATGGITFRRTGSTGDGYRFAKMLNIDVVKPEFGLSPVYLNEFELEILSGVSFEDTRIYHFRDNKKIGSYTGDLLITHFGFSGPVIINNSRYLKKDDIIKINFTKFKTKEELEKKILFLLNKETKKSIRNIITSDILKKRLASHMFTILKIDENIKSSELKKLDRKRIIDFMFEYKAKLDLVGKEHIAMVTIGGISTKEINKNTMASKKIPSIYFAGECIDVDGDTGGYNIQFAFSSGIAAIRDIKKELLDG